MSQPRRNLILGTAGHIDHGKTALVRALTGVETDRLQEEKARGITIDLGFAELEGVDGMRIGVVDVPGHEGFVRNMLAGATGMDVVLLVVAADEGVMPQTREHLAILDLLPVDRLVVALTKADLVEKEWLELVREEVREHLGGTRFAGAPLHAVSSVTGTGIDALREAIVDAAAAARDHDAADLLVLPVDRVFTVRGTGTVVTGTLWSGTIEAGQRVRLVPGGREARVRGIQMHGAEVARAEAGGRVAVALTGEGIDTDTVARGAVAIGLAGWEESPMLTTRLRVLAGTEWRIEQGQRVRVHLGTAEVMARCAVLDAEAIEPGGEGWVQLRLEQPVAARTGDHLVVRSFSPVTTIGGGRVVESHPPKRKAAGGDVARWTALLDGAGVEAVEAALGLAGVRGIDEALLPVRTGRTPGAVTEALEALEGTVRTGEAVWVGASATAEARAAIVEVVDRAHEREAFLAGVGRERLRAAVPDHAPRGFADTLIDALVAAGTLEQEDGAIRRSGFRPVLTEAQAALRERLLAIFREGGLAPPLLDELPAEMRADPAFVPILRGLEAEDELVQIDEGFLCDRGAAEAMASAVRSELAGREALGPADFRECIPVTRKHLVPLLGWLDRTGVTHRGEAGRSVRG